MSQDNGQYWNKGQCGGKWVNTCVVIVLGDQCHSNHKIFLV